MVLAGSLHLGHAVERGGNEVLDFLVGFLGDDGNSLPLLAAGVLRWEDESGGGHSDWGWKGLVFEVG